MGKIKKILENELVGGTQSTDVYPVTSTKAVYDENNENLDSILNSITEKLNNKVNTSAIVQQTGDSTTSVMSQKAVTDAIQAEINRATAAEQTIIYDVSSHNNGAVFESLSALLSSHNLSTLIPTSARTGGMTIRFIQGYEQSSDNNYVQFSYMSDDATTVATFTNVNNWDEIGRTAQKISELGFVPTVPLYPDDEANNWKLLGNGICSKDDSYKLVKYRVNEGDALRLHISKESGGVMQFQSAAHIPSSGVNNNLVGSTYINAVDGVIKVPAGATYLIVSQLKTTITNVVEKKVDANNLVVNSQFVGDGDSNVIVIPEGLIKGRTYSLTFNGNDVTNLSVWATKEGSSDNALWTKDIQVEFEFPILFYIPDDYDYVKFKFRADQGKKVIFSIADVTETLRSLSEQKIPLFEMGRLYKATFPQEYYDSNTTASIKPGYRIHLKEGDIVRLKNSGYNFTLQYVRMDDMSTNHVLPWMTTPYIVKEEGLYIIKISTETETTTYNNSKILASQLEIISKEENLVQNNKAVLDSVVKSLQYNIHNDRTFSFSKTGHYITTNGTLDDSTNWWMSNVVRLYKGETVEIFCATTTFGVIIALTDLEQSFYTPVVVVTDHQVQALHKYTATEDCYIILQYWQITGSPSIYADSERVISIENRLADVESDIEESKASEPQYVIDETERIKRKLLSMLNGNVTIFTFNTDQHFEYPCLYESSGYNPKYVMHGVNAIVDVAKEIPLDMIVMGGDVPGYDGHASSTIKGILQEVEYLNSPFMDLNVPEVSIPGNHDAFQNNGNITAQGMYNVHFKRSKWYNALHHSGSDNCDCYYDDTDKKIRYIFVDTYSRNVRTESYTTFLSNALSSMSEGYKAIIFSHNPLTNEFTGIVKCFSSSEQEDNAFANPTDLHSTINQYAENVVACICGHSHCDAWGINSSGILFIETTTAAPHTIYHTKDGIPYKKTMNSATETAFDFFVIDLDNQTIETVRYGQGTNRKWKYKGTGQGLISYKNCISGTVSIPSLTLTFTNNSNNADVVSVACDGNGFYEVYLTLSATYTITCNGYTLDVSSVEVSENKVVNITATSK